MNDSSDSLAIKEALGRTLADNFNSQTHELYSNSHTDDGPKLLTPLSELICIKGHGRGRKLGSKNIQPALRTECGSHQEYMRKWRAKKNITYEVNFSDLNEIGNKGNNDENKGR